MSQCQFRQQIEKSVMALLWDGFDTATTVTTMNRINYTYLSSLIFVVSALVLGTITYLSTGSTELFYVNMDFLGAAFIIGFTSATIWAFYVGYSEPSS